MLGIPNPENISNVDLILSANRALLCEIRPNMRKITIEYLKKEKKIILFFYYDVPPSEDELDYDVFGTITAEMGCDFPNEISFEEKIIVIHFPKELPQNGVSVYRRYESSPNVHYRKKRDHITPEHSYKRDTDPIKGIPSPENIAKTHLVMSANRVLLGKIRPTMRKIAVEYLINERKINLYFYYDSPPSQEELDCDLFGAISAEMSCDFPNEISFEKKIIILSYPNRLPQKGVGVYRRYEPPPPEEEV